MVLLLRKLYLYFTKDPERSIIFQGLSNFFQGGGGPNAYFYRNPYTYHFRGGCPDPLYPSGSTHGQCQHNETIFITVPLLTIIRLQTELKYPSKNRHRFTQRYNMTKIYIFLTGNICLLQFCR